MKASTIVLFVIVLFGLSPSTLAQSRFDPNDPLLSLTDRFLNNDYDNGYEGVREIVKQGDLSDDVRRLGDLRR